MNVEQCRIQCWDVDAGYAAAQQRYKWARQGWQPPDLIIKGYQEVGAYKCLSWLPGLLDGETYLTPLQIPNLYNVFWRMFTVIKPLLRAYFQSEFAPCFCSMLKMGALVGEEIDDSYRWHRDNGPSSHLKLIIFLNDDHDGGTAVISREDSRKFIDAGYLFGLPEKKRLFRLDEFAEEHGISYTPYKIQPKAGSGLLFEPTNVLHKGVYPTFGERRVFQMGIIPWGEPWESFYEEHWAKGYTNSNGFPRYESGNLA